MTLKTEFPGSENWRWMWWDQDEDFTVDMLVEDLMKADVVAFDTETTGLDETQAKLVAMSFAFRLDGETWAWTICFDDRTDWDDPRLYYLKLWLADPDERKVLANAKYDINVLAHNGLELSGVYWDTMIADQVIYDSEMSHSLDACSLRLLGLNKIPTAAVFDEKVGWGPVPRSELALYANEDVVAALLVYHAQAEDADAANLWDTVMLEMGVLPFVAEMEFHGVRIDVDRLNDLTEVFGAERDRAYRACEKEAAEARAQWAAARRKVYEALDKKWQSLGPGEERKALTPKRAKARSRMRAAEEPINLNSGPQLAELLYGTWELHRKLGLRHPPKTRKGQPATDADIMAKLAPYSKFVQELLTWREVAKLVGTYTEKLPGMLSPATGRLHCNFKQCGAGTGRFTCSGPNLQNIPIRTELGRKLRECFIPEEGWVLVALDYSQIEPRLVAHLSQEPVWLEAFRTGEDLYTATAKAIWPDIPRDATKDDIPVQRAKAKTVTLGMLYGAGPAKIANEAKIPYDEAVSLIDAFWGALPVLRAWLDKQVEAVRADPDHCAYTMFGRRRHLPDIKHKWSGPRGTAERAAANTPVQGGAADILKKAIAELARCRYGWPDLGEGILPELWRPLLQIHDEIVFEVKAEVAELFISWASEVMEGVVKLSVPLKVGGTHGDTWAEAH